MEDRLVKFARIVEAGSFTKAAAAMHISQPALTVAVKKLERELQAELLIRGGHTFTLTAAGQVAYETAQQLITQTQNLHTQVREVVQQKTVLHIGMIDSIAHLLFRQNTYFDRLEHSTQLSLSIDNSSRLIESVEHNELDVALVARPERLQASLKARAIGGEPLVLVAHTERVTQVQQEISARQLRHFMSYNQASRTHQVVTRHFEQLGVHLQPTFYSTSPEIMLQLVLSQRGAAVLPYLLVTRHLEEGQLQVVRIGKSPLIRRSIISVQRSGRILSAQAQVLLENTRQELHILDKEATHL